MPMITSSPWFDSVKEAKRYPALKGPIKADVAVVGAGIAGVMTSWLLAKRGLRVALLEKNRVASGDTSYSTAFLTRVPDTSIHALAERYGLPYLRQVFQASAEAQDLLRDTIKKEGLDCDYADCASYYYSYSAKDSTLAREWRTIRQVDERAEWIAKREAIDAASPIKAAVRFEGEGRFNPRKFIFSLLSKAGSNLQVYEDSTVLGISSGKGVVVRTKGGSVSADKVVLTTGLPLLSVPSISKSIRSKVTYALTARYPKCAPISDDCFWDTKEPYFYFRRLDQDTIMLGGADRYLDEKTRKGTQQPHAKLTSFLARRFPGAVEVANVWSGALFETKDGLPYVDAHPDYDGNVLFATGFGGNGMVMGTLAGMMMADAIKGKENKFSSIFSLNRRGASDGRD